MKRKIEDITNKKRSIQDININRKRKISDLVVEAEEERDQKVQSSNESDSYPKNILKKYNFEYDIDKPQKESKKKLYIAVAIFIIALVFGISSLLSKAEMKVVAKEDFLPLKEVFEANKDPQDGQFGYQVVTLESEASKTTSATVERSGEDKASGTITIKNENDKEQKLIANTRFESSGGMIYRIKEAITIKAKSEIDALVYADESGDKYNLNEGKLTVPGLKNTPSYKTVYAEVKNPIRGGGSSGSKTVDENERKTINIELSAELKKNLLSMISTQVPERFMYYTDSIRYDFEELEESISDQNIATLSKKGKASVVIFDENLLSKEIVNKLKTKNNIETEVVVSNINSLKFSLSKILLDQIETVDKISFELSGDSKIVSVFDEINLKNDILGIKKSDIESLIKVKYPGISQFKANIFPIWKGKIPSNPNKVKVIKVETID